MSDSLPIHIYYSELATAQSMGASFSTSSTFNINTTISYALQFHWSDGTTPIGTCRLQGSNDGANWINISNNAVTGNSGDILYNVEKPAYAYVRITYDRTSGSATANITINGKRA